MSARRASSSRAREPAAKLATASGAARAKKKSPAPRTKPAAPRRARKPAVLPKSDGDAGVQAWIASLEPWQADVVRRVDAVAVKHARGLRKGMRWRCPFYGVDGQGWFLGIGAFQFHVKLTFFLGARLDPVPPVGQDRNARSLDVRESDALDEKQLARWIRQAAKIPGWDGGSPRNGGVAL